jgi:hypothetical protein
MSGDPLDEKRAVLFDLMTRRGRRPADHDLDLIRAMPEEVLDRCIAHYEPRPVYVS